MLYMVIEKFRDGDAVLPVYRRFRQKGRMAPPDLRYVASWVDEDCTTCFQVMDSPDRALLEEWMSQWRDLIDFEVLPVITSQEAAEKMAPRVGGELADD